MKKAKQRKAKAPKAAAEAIPEFLHAPGTYYLRTGEQFVARDYPLELLSSIAAQLLKGSSYEELKTAAETALGLLTECDRLRERHTIARREVREMVQSTWQYTAGTLREGTPIIPYERGIRILTSQKRTDRAEANFRLFLKALFREWTREQIDSFVQERRAWGFYQLPLEAWRRQFEEMVATGEMGKRKPPLKNGIDGNFRPRRATKKKRPASKTGKPAT